MLKLMQLACLSKVLTFYVAILSASLKQIFVSPVVYFSPPSRCMVVGSALLNLGDDQAGMDSFFCLCVSLCSVSWALLCLAGPNPL